MAAPEARNLVSRWDGYLVQLQLQPQGMCLVQLLRTQLDQPRSDWEASWPRGLGQEEEGLSDGRKCLLSQVTRAADIATLGVPWAQSRSEGRPFPPSSSMAGPLPLPIQWCQLESTVTTPQTRMHILS